MAGGKTKAMLKQRGMDVFMTWGIGRKVVLGITMLLFLVMAVLGAIPLGFAALFTMFWISKIWKDVDDMEDPTLGMLTPGTWSYKISNFFTTMKRGPMHQGTWRFFRPVVSLGFGPPEDDPIKGVNEGWLPPLRMTSYWALPLAFTLATLDYPFNWLVYPFWGGWHPPAVIAVLLSLVGWFATIQVITAVGRYSKATMTPGVDFYPAVMFNRIPRDKTLVSSLISSSGLATVPAFFVFGFSVLFARMGIMPWWMVIISTLMIFSAVVLISLTGKVRKLYHVDLEHEISRREFWDGVFDFMGNKIPIYENEVAVPSEEDFRQTNPDEVYDPHVWVATLAFPVNGVYGDYAGSEEKILPSMETPDDRPGRTICVAPIPQPDENGAGIRGSISSIGIRVWWTDQRITIQDLINDTITPEQVEIAARYHVINNLASIRAIGRCELYSLRSMTTKESPHKIMKIQLIPPVGVTEQQFLANIPQISAALGVEWVRAVRETTRDKITLVTLYMGARFDREGIEFEQPSSRIRTNLQIADWMYIFYDNKVTSSSGSPKLLSARPVTEESNEIVFDLPPGIDFGEILSKSDKLRTSAGNAFLEITNGLPTSWNKKELKRKTREFSNKGSISQFTAVSAIKHPLDKLFAFGAYKDELVGPGREKGIAKVNWGIGMMSNGQILWDDFESSPSGSHLLIAGSSGSGKDIDSKTITYAVKPNQTPQESIQIPIGELEVGYKVIHHDGNFYEVTDIHDQGTNELYRVTFNDGTYLDVSKDHQWKIIDGKEKYSSYHKIQHCTKNNFGIRHDKTELIMKESDKYKSMIRSDIPENVKPYASHVLRDNILVDASSWLPSNDISNPNEQYNESNRSLAATKGIPDEIIAFLLLYADPKNNVKNIPSSIIKIPESAAPIVIDMLNRHQIKNSIVNHNKVNNLISIKISGWLSNLIDISFGLYRDFDCLLTDLHNSMVDNRMTRITSLMTQILSTIGYARKDRLESYNISIPEGSTKIFNGWVSYPSSLESWDKSEIVDKDSFMYGVTTVIGDRKVKKNNGTGNSYRFNYLGRGLEYKFFEHGIYGYKRGYGNIGHFYSVSSENYPDFNDYINDLQKKYDNNELNRRIILKGMESVGSMVTGEKSTTVSVYDDTKVRRILDDSNVDYRVEDGYLIFNTEEDPDLSYYVDDELHYDNDGHPVATLEWIFNNCETGEITYNKFMSEIVSGDYELVASAGVIKPIVSNYNGKQVIKPSRMFDLYRITDVLDILSGRIMKQDGGNRKPNGIEHSVVTTENMIDILFSYPTRPCIDIMSPINYDGKEIVELEMHPYELGTQIIDKNYLENDFIPEEYFKSSIESRLELLRGILDTKGSPSGEVIVEGKKLSDDIVRLMRELGVKTKVCESEKDSYLIKFSHPEKMVLFNLENKQKEREKYLSDNPQEIYYAYKYVESIEKMEGEYNSRCITVNSPDHTFITGDGYNTTHNSVVLHDMIAQLALKNDPADLEIHIIEPKNGTQVFENLDSVTRYVDSWVPRDGEFFEATRDLIVEDVREMERRNGLMRNRPGLQKPEKLAEARAIAAKEGPLPDGSPHPLWMPYKILIVEECATVFTGSTDKEEKEVQAEILYFATRIAREARSAGILMVNLTQYPTNASIPSIIRQQMRRVGLKTKDKLASQIIIGEDGLQSLSFKGSLMGETDGIFREARGFFLNHDFEDLDKDDVVQVLQQLPSRARDGSLAPPGAKISDYIDMPEIEGSVFNRWKNGEMARAMESAENNGKLDKIRGISLTEDELNDSSFDLGTVDDFKRRFSKQLGLVQGTSMVSMNGTGGSPGAKDKN